MSNPRYTIGLDVGIASVGFGVIDEERNIVEAGVRLFPEADKTENESRRTKRSARRLKRRRSHRKERVQWLLERSEFPTYYKGYESPYHLRVKGLRDKLDEEELSASLLHLIKRRGIHNVDHQDDDLTGEDSLSTKDQVKRNAQALEERFVCELQLERLEEEGEVRGHRNRFKTSDYVKEATTLLKKQQEFHEKISDDFIDEFIQLLSKRREYYEGPGLGSPYGWEQDTKKWYEQMMGRCSYFPDEFRCVKASYSAQLYNALNDLNNLRINREEPKLTTEEKERLIESVFKGKGSITLKKIAKEISVSEEDIKGSRVNARGKPEFTELQTYHDLRKVTEHPDTLNQKQMDDIAERLTMWQNPEEKLSALEELDTDLPAEVLQKMSEELNYSGTHALSKKAIDLLLPELWHSSKNQMEIFSELGLKPKKVELKGLSTIPDNHIEDIILSPVVKRSFKQAIRVVNELIRKYGNPHSIVVELAREKNSQDKKKFINKMLKQHAALNKQIREKLDEHDLDANHSHFEKLRLWHLQDGQCLYSHKAIRLEDLLDNPMHYEVDHIIPRSVSFDDSQKNKVLVLTEENQKKGNRTPFQYLSSGSGTITYQAFKAHVLQLAKSSEKMPRKKKDYLLEERNITKYEVQKDFINRNLVDTRYATRELLNLLQSYFRENESGVKVKSINGGFTNYLRKIWRFRKNREEDFKHHAEDALIVAMADYLFESQKELKEANAMMTNQKSVDMETGEILNQSFGALFTDQFYKVEAIKSYGDYKYSHRVDQKPNRQLMNDTIYSTRTFEGEEYTVGKIKDLYDKDNEDLKKKLDKSPEAFLMYSNDPKTFEKLKVIMKQYADAKNPLAKRLEETGEYLTKYSKKGNGPVVKAIKYRQKKLNVHKDLSHKYHPKNKKVVTLSLKPYRMDVFEDEGKYKFLTIRYDDLNESKMAYTLDERHYENKLQKKGISDTAVFLFSLYKNNVIEINGEKFRFVGVNDDDKNKIECKPVHTHGDKRIMKYIGNSTKVFHKYNVDVLGNEYKNQIEKARYVIPK
ncbi:type II CRISPR RNA-guided endonuclease Cas9 [Halobacillus locisalis]|uniref:CRISPR-associated endonuclease Cas9 n=1 Tax=Halobacillus locisalis TaxID=220753 RepID=A0A838CYB6_9BACI|nr:type II CRISPR RNA-guided endonuclease Cas9 [Halobacillus locisalis]MBA2176868.1 type II CRISPR RNA-guided endonuclease Cas9 [Halobacillus locisalis]